MTMPAEPSVAPEVTYPPRFWLLTAAAFMLALTIGGAIVFLIERARAQEERQMTAEIANLNAREIGDRLERALSASFALAAVVRQGGGRIDRFEQLAGEMVRTYGGIGALQYAPEGVVRQIVPLAGNEAALGFSPLKDPKQRFEAQKAVDSRRLVLTGPFSLVQGGYGVVGRYPVFLDERTGKERFWGLIQVVVRIPELLAVTSLGSLEASGYRYELWRIDPQNGERVVFARTAGQPLQDTVDAVIVVPGGQWILSVASRKQQGFSGFLLIEGAVVVLLSCLAAIAVAMLQREPLLLRREIQVREAAERELQRSRARLQEIIDTLDAGVALWDAEHRLMAWNDAVERLFPELRPILRVGLERAELEEAIRKSGRYPSQEETTAFGWNSIGTWDYRMNDGRIISVQRLPTADGGRLVLNRDVTEVRRSAEVLARNDRMASLGRLVGGIAHEVNTPIGNALMVVSSMQDRLQQLERTVTSGQLRRSELIDFIHKVREADEIALRNLNRAAELVQHFKQVAVDQTSDRRRRFDLAETLSDIVSTLSVRLRRSSHRLDLNLEPEVAMESYPGALGQVVVNLIENALLHAFPGRDGGEMRLSSRRLPDGRVELEFSDNGAGIAEADLPRIFDPFFTTRLGQGGSGLGLSIVLNLVRDLLGGEVEIDSKLGRGTCFRLLLPLVAPAHGGEEAGNGNSSGA